jgi:hypothetical protein
LAELTARRSALLVPWRALQAELLRYVEWYEVALWARSIEEAARAFPDELQQALNSRCPGFLDHVREQRPQDQFPWLALMSWVHAHRFQEARNGGWFPALTYFAERHWIVRSAWKLWEQYIDEWRVSAPAAYPDFETWRTELRCRYLPVDLERGVETLVEQNALLAWFDLVSAGGIGESVLLSLEREWPRVFRSSCPAAKHPRDLRRRAMDLNRRQFPDTDLLTEIQEHASTHLRALRVAEYADRCRQAWREAKPSVYSQFHEWLNEADVFVDKHAVAPPSEL